MWTPDTWIDKLSYRDTSPLQNLSRAATTSSRESQSLSRCKFHQLAITIIPPYGGENPTAFEGADPNPRAQGCPLLLEHGEKGQTEDKVCWQARQNCMGQEP
jgi:hypothetical protein